MAKVKLGFQGVLYRNTGSYGSPVWSEVTGLSDVSLTSTMDSADSTARGQGGLGTEEPTILRIEISGKIRDDESNGAYEALQEAFYGRDAVDLLILDGPKTLVGSHGVRAEFKLHNWTQDQGLTAAIFNDFTLKPCVGNPAQRAEIETTNVVTLTDITALAA